MDRERRSGPSNRSDPPTHNFRLGYSVPEFEIHDESLPEERDSFFHGFDGEMISFLDHFQKFLCRKDSRFDVDAKGVIGEECIPVQ